MSSQAWQKYLRPHRSPEIPAVVRLVLAILSGAILSLSYQGTHPSLYTWVCLAILLISILGSRGWVVFACGYLHGLFFAITCVPWIADVLAVHGGMSTAAGWGVLLIIAFPLIAQLKHSYYAAVSGVSETAYLTHWLLVTAFLFIVSAVLYLARVAVARRDRS